MVPQPRLLKYTAFVVVPLTALVGLFSQWAFIYIAALCVFVILVLLDAALAQGILKDVRLEAASLQRLTRDRAGAITVQVERISSRPQPLRIGLRFPAEIETESLIQHIDEAIPRKGAAVSWHVLPLRRGQYFLRNGYLETRSGMGFWAIRRTVPLTIEIRVYPNLVRAHKSVAGLFTRLAHVGIHTQRQLGKGHEFELLRKYVSGDSYEDIDWKATARRRTPITRVFQIEKTQEIYVVVDTSRLSARQVDDQSANQSGFKTTMLDRFISAALILALSAEKQGDNFGLLLLDDRVRRFLPAKNGKQHYNICRDMLYTVEPQTITPDFDELYTFIRTRIRRRAMIIVLTSLDDPSLAESFVRHLELIVRQHLVLVAMPNPSQAKPLFSDRSIRSTDDIYNRLGGHIRWQNLQDLGKVLKRHGVQFSLLDQDEMVAQLVMQYINIKRRQIL